MTPERWQRIKTLYDAARSRPARERSAFLGRACAGDTDLQLEVESLLDQPVGTADFVGFVGGPVTPPVGVAIAGGGAHLVGRRLGTFQVQSLLGRGGMGEVYRAHDTRLGRDVAIKVLPGELTIHPERVANLEREARVVASLNHPNIAAIHGLEESEGVRGLVLELVEGQTLAEWLRDAAASSPPGLRLKEALKIARQIADALEAAHEKGITHRDLKPANVKITPDGVVKLLDFGIAKVVTGDAPPLDLTQAQTVTSATRAGLVVGTAAYMSPEQARGKLVDKRTDIWAFGCVLYEMLSGKMAFEGDTVSDTIAAVIERDPDWSNLPVDTPRSVRRLIQRCLEKDQKQRLRDIGDARAEIERIIQSPNEDTDADVAQHESRTWQRRARLAIAGVIVAGGVSTGLIALLLSRGNVEPGDIRVTRFTVDLPKDSWMVPTFNSNLTFSPDGRTLALTPLPGALYLRRLDGFTNEPLEATKVPGFRGSPLFSPDGAFVSFVEGNGIISKSRPFLKAALSGGAATKLADYDNFHGGDWGADGWIYWTAAYPGGIVRIRDSGGPIEPVTELDVANGERSHRFAQLLPGGEALIYTVGFEGINSYDDARIDLWDMRTRQRKTLVSGGTHAQYSPSGHIVYASAGKLFAVPFDVEQREVTGAAFLVVDGVMMSRNTGAAHFAISKRGDLAYAQGGTEGDSRTLVWVDRTGKEEPLPLEPASYLYPRIAPNSRSMAVEIEGLNHSF